MKKERREILYSIGILIAIPALLIFNTLFLVRSTQQTFNDELRKKSDIVNSVIAESAKKEVVDGDATRVQQTIDAIEKTYPTITTISVIQKNNTTLETIARAGDQSEQIETAVSHHIQFAYDNKLPVAKFIDTYTKEGQPSQAWVVATPVMNEKEDVVGVVMSSTLTIDAQEKIDAAYMSSFIVLIISTLVVIALLFRHFRLVGYAQLLAKQKELNQTMSDFLSVATHELKAPTSIIKGYLSNVMDGTFGAIEPKIKEQLDVAFAQTDRLNGLVQDLLNVSRVEQGRISYDIQNVDSTAIIQTLVSNYAPIAAEKGLELRIETSQEIPAIRADSGRVQEIFTNLIDNAIKYTAKGSVTVSQNVEGSMVKTNIIDTGFGMSPDARKRLFQRFYRVRTAETQNINGTGLGLWIIKQYIVAMGGTIDVETMEGVGSHFIVKLPIAST